MADKNTIELIKALRERTGAGMMDCKHALEESNYDIEKAVDSLREKGIVKQAKRANRTAAEGLTRVKVCPECSKAALIEVNCETDFVSGSDKFIALADGLVGSVMKNEPKDLEAAKADNAQLLQDTALAVGEKVDFRRFAIIAAKANQIIGSYIHMGGKISVAVLIEGGDLEFANKLAMHIAANSPLYVELKDVPADERAREKAVAIEEVKADPKISGKPDAVKERITEAKVDKVLGQSCLLLQQYLLDESKTVAQVLLESGAKVVSFVRYQVGEGIARDVSQEN
ncbi:MAG: translation elongation factor Ts [Bacilli bacterium]